jgi:hypothetical protein
MDRETLIGIVERKHHFRVDPNDPVFMLATISEAMLDEARGELQKIITDAISQAASANLQAEAAAREKIEATVHEAGERAAARIREASDAAVTRILTEIQKSQQDATAAAQRIRRKAILLLACSVTALLTIAIVVVGIWIR